MKNKNMFGLVARSGAAFLSAWLVTSSETQVFAANIIRDSHIETDLVIANPNLYTYEYTVFNDSPGDQNPTYLNRGRWSFPLDGTGIWPLIISYEIPILDRFLISDITSPHTWAYEFLTNEEFESRFGPNPFGNTEVLRWYDTDPPPMFAQQATAQKTIAPKDFNYVFESDQYEPYASGFSLKSPLAPVDGPYAVQWHDFNRQVGDPPLPGVFFPPSSSFSIPQWRTTSVPEGMAFIWALPVIFGMFIVKRRQSRN